MLCVCSVARVCVAVIIVGAFFFSVFRLMSGNGNELKGEKRGWKSVCGFRDCFRMDNG